MRMSLATRMSSGFSSSFTIDSILARPTYRRCVPYTIPHPYSYIVPSPGYIGKEALTSFIEAFKNNFSKGESDFFGSTLTHH